MVRLPFPRLGRGFQAIRDGEAFRLYPPACMRSRSSARHHKHDLKHSGKSTYIDHAAGTGHLVNMDLVSPRG